MIYSLGICPVVILATDLIVGSALVERAGTASAISEVSSELGGVPPGAVLRRAQPASGPERGPELALESPPR